jgi:succinoglycan biosynthesis transport protein ExoP
MQNELQNNGHHRYYTSDSLVASQETEALKYEQKKTEFTFWDNFRRAQWAITKRSWILVLIFIFSLAGAVIYLRNQPDIYQASGALKVKPRVQNVVGEAIDRMPSRFYATTWEELQQGPPTQRAFRQVAHLIKPNEKPPILELDVIMPRTSDIFRVFARSDNPEYAKEYLNALFMEFIRYKREEITDVSRTAIDTYTRELISKMDQLRQAEDRLLEFRRQNPEIYIEDVTSPTVRKRNELANRVKEIETQIELLEDLKDFFYKSNTARESIENFRFEREGLSKELIERTLNETAWQKAKSDYDTINTELNNLRLYFKSKHPVIREKEEQLRVAKSKLDLATENSEKEFSQRIEELQRQLAIFREQMKIMTSDTINISQKISEHDRLMKEVERIRGLYLDMSARLEAITVSVDTSQDVVSIYQTAEVSSKPVRPNKTRTLITAGIVSLLLGCGIVLIIDRVMNKVCSPEQVEEEIGLDLLGVVPKLSIPVRKPEKRLFVNNPEQFGFSESFRTIRSVLVQLRTKTSIQVIQITSPQPNDGKSFVSLNISLALSQIGSSVLLIGADLRRPGIHRPFGISNDTGLSEVLQNLKDWKSQVKNTGFENLHLLPSGQTPLDPVRLLQTTTMRNIIFECRQHYDWIILDCPPLVAVSDAIVTAPLCDATILVLRSESTPVRLAQVAISILNKRARFPLGAVLNAIDLKRGYYPSYGYYRYQEAHYKYGSHETKAKFRNTQKVSNKNILDKYNQFTVSI